jgi:hypothetical protein
MSRPLNPYVVSWNPEADGYALAAKRGWKEGEALFDYVEEHQFQKTGDFRTFAEAVDFARMVVPVDVTGEVRIARLEYTKLGSRLKDVQYTQEDAVWHVYDDTDTIDENKPDHRPEPLDDAE